MSSSDTNPDWVEPGDAPELNNEWFDEATMRIGGKPADRGGRRLGSDKSVVTMSVDNDVLERLRSDGPGWQTRANEALRTAVGLLP